MRSNVIPEVIHNLHHFKRKSLSVISQLHRHLCFGKHQSKQVGMAFCNFPRWKWRSWLEVQFHKSFASGNNDIKIYKSTKFVSRVFGMYVFYRTIRNCYFCCPCWQFSVDFDCHFRWSPFDNFVVCFVQYELSV